ncbi:hypothetical protein ATJ97_3610 [Georgenia soli]|uniref:Uncharacterized protein n=1 Tax=Georgenia soli TaxID=638953 RepID=A0A2A9EQ17_9MICO|nr:hypothetical protein [Georgenia soli]PFG41064.1 hypothetical protein ATJ97_3610 [Georgenia soli]
MRTRWLVGLGLLLLAGGLTLALAVPTSGWFAWMGDDSLAAAVVASGRVFVMGAPQFVGLGAALAGLLALACAVGMRIGRRREAVPPTPA